MTAHSINRRRFERFTVQPEYTSAAVRIHPDDTQFGLEGHISDISEGGICFDIDQPVQPGQTISMKIDLPEHSGDIGPGRAVFVTGNVVWCEVDDAGASQAAMVITRFDRAGDKQRMIKALMTPRFKRAA